MPNPAANFAVYRAGTDEAVARGSLEPGAEPLSLRLENPGTGRTNIDWLVQVDHPWLGVEAVIFRANFRKLRAEPGFSPLSSPGRIGDLAAGPGAFSPDISLSWKLLTWGPDALASQDWVAAVQLSASAEMITLYTSPGVIWRLHPGELTNGMLPDDQVVLGQEICVPIVTQVGVTSAGQSLSRALAVQLVMPECR